MEAWAATQAARSGLVAAPAKMSVELHPPVAIDKGTASPGWPPTPPRCSSSATTSATSRPSTRSTTSPPTESRRLGSRSSGRIARGGRRARRPAVASRPSPVERLGALRLTARRSATSVRRREIWSASQRAGVRAAAAARSRLAPPARSSAVHRQRRVPARRRCRRRRTGCTATAAPASSSHAPASGDSTSSAVALVDQRALLGHQVQAVADRVDEQDVVAPQRGDRPGEVVGVVERIGCPVAVPHRSLMSATRRSTSCGRGRSPATPSRDGYTNAPNTTWPRHSGVLEQVVVGVEAAQQVLGQLDAVDADDELPVADRARRAAARSAHRPSERATPPMSSASGPSGATNVRRARRRRPSQHASKPSAHRAVWKPQAWWAARPPAARAAAGGQDAQPVGRARTACG